MGEAGDRHGARGMSVRVYDLAHARAGDKGNTSNISVTAYSDEGWQVLQRNSRPNGCWRISAISRRGRCGGMNCRNCAR